MERMEEVVLASKGVPMDSSSAHDCSPSRSAKPKTKRMMGGGAYPREAPRDAVGTLLIGERAVLKSASGASAGVERLCTRRSEHMVLLWVVRPGRMKA